MGRLGRRALIRAMIAQRTEALVADFDARLEKRKAGRAARNARSKRSAITRQHDAYARDVLIREATST